MYDEKAREQFLLALDQPDHTIEFEHEEGSYHVSRRSIVIHSEIFRKMFEANMRETKTAKVDMNAFAHDAMIYAVKYLMFASPTLTLQSVQAEIDIWRFAHMYEMQHLLGIINSKLDGDAGKLPTAVEIYNSEYSSTKGLDVHRAKAKKTLVDASKKYISDSICVDSYPAESLIRHRLASNSDGKSRVCCKHYKYIIHGYTEYNGKSLCRHADVYKKYCCACKPKLANPGEGIIDADLKLELYEALMIPD